MLLDSQSLNVNRGENKCCICLTAVQYLETDELLVGKAVTVDYLNLFDQGALATFCRSWHTNQRNHFKNVNTSVEKSNYYGLTHQAWGFSPHSSQFWHVHKGLALFSSSGVSPFSSLQWYPGEGTFPYRSKKEFTVFIQNLRDHGNHWL